MEWLQLTFSEQLKQALWITKLNEGAKSDAGESARVMNKLSQAYIANGDIKKGSDMRKDADTIYSDLIKTGEYTASDDPVLKWDYLVCLNFRWSHTGLILEQRRRDPGWKGCLPSAEDFY